MYRSTHISNMISEAACWIKNNAKILRWIVTWAYVLVTNFDRYIQKLAPAWSGRYYQQFRLVAIEL